MQTRLFLFVGSVDGSGSHCVSLLAKQIGDGGKGYIERIPPFAALTALIIVE